MFVYYWLLFFYYYSVFLTICAKLITKIFFSYMTNSKSSSRKRNFDRFDVNVGQIVKERMLVEIDPSFGKSSSLNVAKFSGYLGLIAWQHVFIVIPTWDEVEET